VQHRRLIVNTSPPNCNKLRDQFMAMDDQPGLPRNTTTPNISMAESQDWDLTMIPADIVKLAVAATRSFPAAPKNHAHSIENAFKNWRPQSNLRSTSLNLASSQTLSQFSSIMVFCCSKMEYACSSESRKLWAVSRQVFN